jgi:hypothetical protein
VPCASTENPRAGRGGQWPQPGRPEEMTRPPPASRFEGLVRSGSRAHPVHCLGETRTAAAIGSGEAETRPSYGCQRFAPRAAPTRRNPLPSSSSSTRPVARRLSSVPPALAHIF